LLNAVRLKGEGLKPGAEGVKKTVVETPGSFRAAAGLLRDPVDRTWKGKR
jgi:hypothetical protein